MLLLELYFHPFRSALFDLLEEFTTLTEVCEGVGEYDLVVEFVGGQASPNSLQPLPYPSFALTLTFTPSPPGARPPAGYPHHCHLHRCRRHPGGLRLGRDDHLYATHTHRARTRARGL